MLVRQAHGRGRTADLGGRSRPVSVRVRTVGDGPISTEGGVAPGQVAEIIVALDGEPGRRGSGYRMGPTSVHVIKGAVSVRVAAAQRV